MQLWSIHTRYDCARKVLVNHKDLQRLPERQARGTLQKIWCDWTFSSKKTQKEAYKAISRENARRMIDTTEMLMHDRREAYESGCLSVYMEDVVRRLERLQRGESEEEKSRWLTRRKQQIWDEQYKTAPRQPGKPQGEIRGIVHPTRNPWPQTRDTPIRRHRHTRTAEQSGGGSQEDGQHPGGVAHATGITMGEGSRTDVRHYVPLVGHRRRRHS